MQLTDKTVLVTGANRGIGEHLVRELLVHDVKRIYAAARKPEKLPDFKDQRVVPLKLDITDNAEIKAATEAARDTDILINNAGVATFAGVLSGPLEMIVRDMETNYYGTLNTVRAFVPVLEANGGGSIINLLTLLSLASMSGLGGYSASKAALFSATQALRVELKNKNINVVAVFPGAIDTDMIRDVEMAKTPPQNVAKAVIDGLLKDEEDIFPDPMSAQLGQVWLQSPKELERTFASM